MVILDSPIISLDSTAKIIEIMKSKYVCQIQVQISGNPLYTGFFCYIHMGKIKVPVMITSLPVINNESFRNEKIIKFKFDKDYKEIKINDNRTIYTNEHYEIAIIEINPSKDKIKYFLDLDDNIFNENLYYYKDKSIYIIQYNNEKGAISVSYGYLRNYFYRYDNLYDVFSYSCSTINGASGSPIINLSNNKIIGIHMGYIKNMPDKMYNYGTKLALPINEFIISKYKEKNFINSKLISSGSYGDVYSAYSLILKKDICLKKINIEKMKLNYMKNQLNDYQNDLDNEIKILDLFGYHDNSIKYYGNYEEGNEKIIVMEKCDMNLKQFMEQKKSSLKIEEIKEQFSKINKLFYRLQFKRIIHRDLKLENILIKFINEKKTEYILKLGDYGIGKFKSESNGIFSGLKGTPDTVAPEIILEKKKTYENIIDIFSLGIILYQLSHNLKHPFGSNYIECLMNYQNNYEKDNIIISFDNSIENDDFKDLIRKMLKLNPENRLKWDEYFEHPFWKK